MRALVVLLPLALASVLNGGLCDAKLTAESIKDAKECTFGAPGADEYGTEWKPLDCDKTDPEAKAAALGDAEFYGSSRLTRIYGGHHEAVHGKIAGRCCSAKATKAVGLPPGAPKQEFSVQEICCYPTCPDWMKKC